LRSVPSTNKGACITHSPSAVLGASPHPVDSSEPPLAPPVGEEPPLPPDSSPSPPVPAESPSPNPPDPSLAPPLADSAPPGASSPEEEQVFRVRKHRVSRTPLRSGNRTLPEVAGAF